MVNRVWFGADIRAVSGGGSRVARALAPQWRTDVRVILPRATNRRTSHRRRALDEVPHIEALVVLKESNGDGLPGEGFDALPDWSQMSLEEKKELHSRDLQENVLPYERWADVLDELDPTNPFRSWVRSISCRRHD